MMAPDTNDQHVDLGELEKLSAAATQGDIVAEPYTDDHGGCYLMAGEIQIAAGLTEEDGAYLAALARDHRSGKLVASTGSGKEETKGASFGSGSCPSGPTASRSSGLAAAIPSRGWQPIATAPRTFQPILLDLGRGKHGGIARAPVIGVWSDFCGGWAFWGAPKVPVSPQPIRWHVLPLPHEAPSDAPSTTEAVQ